MPSPLVVGMVGYNFMGRAHSNAWRQAGRFFDLPAEIRLKTLCGRNLERAQAAAATLGWESACPDWRVLVADPEIDIIDISAPNAAHAEIAIAAAQAGKAVLCEKPLGLNVAECEAMVAAVEAAGVVNMVCHNYRAVPAVALAKRMIERGDLGDRIYHYRARYAQDWIMNPDFPLVWRLQSDQAGSGALGDINAHIIDIGRYLVGEIIEVSGVMETFIKERPLLPTGLELDNPTLGQPDQTNPSRQTGEVTVDDAVSWVGCFANGAMANLESTRFAAGRKNHLTFEINGSKGSLTFDFEDMNRLGFYNGADPGDARGFREILVTEAEHPYAGSWWPPGHGLGYEHTFVNLFAEFIRACVEGKSTPPTFADGLANERVQTAVRESARTRQWVSL